MRTLRRASKSFFMHFQSQRSLKRTLWTGLYTPSTNSFHNKACIGVSYATIRDIITDHVVWLLWWMPDVQPPQKRSCFACPATSKELEQSSKGFLSKNTEKLPMGYAGISGLAKNRNAQIEEKATVRKIYWALTMPRHWRNGFCYYGMEYWDTSQL